MKPAGKKRKKEKRPKLVHPEVIPPPGERPEGDPGPAPVPAPGGERKDRRRLVLILAGLGLAGLALAAGILWNRDYDDSVYRHPPPDAYDLRFKYDEVNLLQRMFFTRLQYFNCIDRENGIEFALALAVGNPRDMFFPGRSMVFAKIFYPEGGFEYRVSDYPGKNFSGSKENSDSRVSGADGNIIGEIVQREEDVINYRGRSSDGYFRWDVTYERDPPFEPAAVKNAWYIWDEVPTRGLMPRGTVSYLSVMTRARVNGWFQAGDRRYRVKNGNGYADLYWGTASFVTLTWTWIAYQGKDLDVHLYHNLNNNAGSLRLRVKSRDLLIFPRGNYRITYPPEEDWRWDEETGTRVPGECTVLADDGTFRTRIHWRARKTAFVLMDVPVLNRLIRDSLTYEMISDFEIEVWRRASKESEWLPVAAETGRGFSDWTRRLGWGEKHPARTDEYKTNLERSGG